jgi:hypothetical protein
MDINATNVIQELTNALNMSGGNVFLGNSGLMVDDQLEIEGNADKPWSNGHNIL